MFGLKLFKRSEAAAPRRPALPETLAPPQQLASAPRAAGPPPPPPPPEAFLSARTAPTPLLTAPSFPAIDVPTTDVPRTDVSVTDPGAPARVRFFYTDGTVSEPDPQEAERMGYLATNLLEASREDSP